MPKEYDDLVKRIKRGIRSGKIPKTYKSKTGGIKETNPYALAHSLLNQKKKIWRTTR